jgi:hypothetical protein
MSSRLALLLASPEVTRVSPVDYFGSVKILPCVKNNKKMSRSLVSDD